MRFNAGDKVVCVKDMAYFTQGKTYDIVLDDEGRLMMTDDTEYHSFILENYFIGLAEYRQRMLDEI